MCPGMTRLGESEGWAIHEKRAFAQLKFHSSKVLEIKCFNLLLVRNLGLYQVWRCPRH